eukprot:jgi/Chlat1/1032/Chrsp109S01454
MTTTVSIVSELADVLPLEDHHLLPQLEQYLELCIVDEDNPALLFCWDHGAVNRFVQVANTQGYLFELPPWVSSPAGEMTVAVFMSDVVTYVAQMGGRFTQLLIAPCTSLEFLHAVYRTVDVERCDFVQACMHTLEMPVLARMAVITDQSHPMSATMCEWPAPGGNAISVFT